jgi:hypothetical protein
MVQEDEEPTACISVCVCNKEEAVHILYTDSLINHIQ